MFWFYGFLTRSKDDGTLIARASTTLVFLNKVYKIKKVNDIQEVSEYNWTKCKYIPVVDKATKYNLWLMITDHYFGRVEKSGIKDLAELDKKQILTANNPYYETIVEKLKRADYLPCTEEEKQKFNPMPESFVRALKVIEHFDRTPENILKEQLYTAYKNTMNGQIYNCRQYVKEWVAEHPETEKYPEYQKIKNGDFGTTSENFVSDLLVDGIAKD